MVLSNVDAVARQLEEAGAELIGPSSFQRPEHLRAITPVHIAFMARSRAEVDAFHKAALAVGGRDFGAPGLRPEYHEHYYGAFVLDPDGHNIEAVFHKPV